MRSFRKILVGVGLAGVLSLSVIWGTRAPAVRHGVSAELTQRSAQVLLAEVVYIQKPGH